MRVIRIRGNGKFVWRVYQDGDLWVASNDELSLTTCGETYAELQESIHDILSHLLTDLVKTGELDAFLTKHGWEREGEPVSGGDVQFDVPWYLDRGAPNELHAPN